MTPRIILFDLDGTLIDSRRGIEHSLRLTLFAHDVHVPEDEDLSWCIGSSLWRIFENFLHTPDRHRLEGAVAMFRHIYRDGPMFEYTVYPGVVEALTQLHRQDIRLVLATAKAHEQAREVIVSTPFASMLHHVYGSELNGTNVEKQDLIKHILHTENIPAEHAIMVGDRHHDINGAVANGVAAIAVSYGYGTTEEHVHASAVISDAGQLVNTVALLSATQR